MVRKECYSEFGEESKGEGVMKLGTTVWFITGNLLCKGQITKVPPGYSLSTDICIKTHATTHIIDYRDVFSKRSPAAEALRTRLRVKKNSLLEQQVTLADQLRAVDRAINVMHLMGI